MDDENEESFYYEETQNAAPDSTDEPVMVYKEDDTVNMTHTKWQ